MPLTEAEHLGFKFERKRIKKDKQLLPICKDYKPTDKFGVCESSKICKNATYSLSENEPHGHCFGGTKESEIEFRNEYLIKKKR